MDENQFDVVVIGTSLAESIVAAALAKAGLRVLHLDESSNYGGRDASLSVIDLHHFFLNPPKHITNLSAPVPISEELLRDSRHYAISLSPSIVSSTGPLVDALVASGVARYVPFKLLDAVGLYGQAAETGLNQSADGEQVRLVPASKEDVFKSKSLGLLQKRKLMKFLVSTATSDANQPPATPHLEADQSNLRGYLTSKLVGLDKDIADAIAYALALSTDPNEPAEPALSRLRKYILSTGRHGNSPFIVGHFGGAGELAQGFCRASAVAGATYILGRPYKMDRSQTKTSQGSNDQRLEMTEDPSILASHSFGVRIEGIDEVLKARLIVSTSHAIPISLLSETQDQVAGRGTARYLARCIAILDAPIRFKRPVTHNEPIEDSTKSLDAEDSAVDEEEKEIRDMDVDSAVLVFPPGSIGPSSESRVATAFIAGPSAMVCPEGKRIVYLSTEIELEASPEETLQPYLSAIQRLNRNTEETSRVYSSLFYTQWLPHSGTPDDGDEIEGIISLRQPSSHIAESGDETAQEAARVFWETIGRLGLDGRGRAREEKSDLSTEPSSSEEIEQDDFVTIMWPPLTNDETEAVDD